MSPNQKPGAWDNVSTPLQLLGWGVLSWLVLGLTVAGTLALCDAIGTAVLFSTVGMTLGCYWVLKVARREGGPARMVGYCVAGLLGLTALAVSGVMSHVVPFLFGTP